MNEVMQIRAASWAAMIKQRNDSGLTIREWCAANGIQESVYYYRLNRLRKMALDVEETPANSHFLRTAGTYSTDSQEHAPDTNYYAAKGSLHE